MLREKGYADVQIRRDISDKERFVQTSSPALANRAKGRGEEKL
jgi:hypothetical protein